MTVMVFIWGFHFIVIKDAVATVPPLAFNALRFMVALPLISLVAWRDRSILHHTPRDLGRMLLVTLIGPVGYQVAFMLGVARTTATNAALLVATMPAWTALVSMLVRMVQVRRRLLSGVLVTLAGVVLVVLSRGSSELALTHEDLIGSGLVLGAALIGAVSSVLSKPLVDELGSMTMAVWRFWFATVGLTIAALPDLLTLSADELPPDVLPNVLYSGCLAGLGGYLVTHAALKVIGPTRTNSYHNFTPMVAALAGIVILGEPLTLSLIAGGALTLVGVLIVRRNTFLRRASDP